MRIFLPSQAGMDFKTATLHRPLRAFDPFLFPFYFPIQVCQDFVAASIEAAARTTSSALNLFNPDHAPREPLSSFAPPPVNFNIDAAQIDGRSVAVCETRQSLSDFTALWSFQAAGGLKNRERLLIVSPNSGHDATIAADMITPLLTRYDVFVMGCLHPYFVARDAGGFGNEAQVDACLDAIQIIGPTTGLIGPSQGGTIATAAMAVMAADTAKFGAIMPQNLMVVGSPIDTRVNPNDLCRIAKYSLVSPHFVNVTEGFAGAGRSVYWMPVAKDGQQPAMAAFDGATLREKIRQPLTADAINDTLKWVYRDHDLPNGTWKHHGRTVDVGATTGGVLTIEADADEVCPTGQTRALLKLTRNAARRQNVVVPGKHYDLVRGPQICNVTNAILDFIPG